MAEETKQEAEEAQEETEKKGSKKGLVLGGGIIGLIAAAYVVVMVAMPSPKVAPPFDGPFVIPLSAEDLQVNLRGDNGRRYLVMNLQATYMGYDETYVQARVADPVYQADLIDALIGVARQKTMSDVEDLVGQETFKEEIQEVVNPLLFPIHIGNETNHVKPDEESGIGPGLSIDDATMRGGFKAHAIHVDFPKAEISLDDGPKVSFDRTEDDLMLESDTGLTIFVDLTGLKDDFSGDVQVGVFGRITSIKFAKFLTQ
ncbi:MAG TPA: flagellar basal body-associated FliL family protein [Planctomycetes bacterium]|nr:flagellar basal body-associated FliL family protein [Planctomycetota bacterium]